MHISSPFSILLAIAGVTNAAALSSKASEGFVVPEGTQDGVYTLSFNEHGEQVMSKNHDLRDLPSLIGANKREEGTHRLERRKKDVYKCYPYTLVSNNIARAGANLGDTCDTGATIAPKTSQVSVAGNVVVFACNQASYTTKRCYSDILNLYIEEIEKWCPSYRAGQWSVYPPVRNEGKYKDTGVYGYTQTGQKMCHDL